ncbi:lysine-specific demethylase phf2 [Patella vulgata]|uniref:lysine-specific demethylase phf2 n=1 Tax=Patella vulgata TaxID=6465 RepID=UPI00217FFA7C|nr:lysine-specific demethylase phf2 [Patella vulgata]
MASDSLEEELYCSCRSPYDETRFMIECEVCKDWFHGSCVGIQEVQAPDIEIFHCPSCEKTHGPLVFRFKKSKKKKNQKAKDYTDENGDKKSSQKKTKKKRKRKVKEEQTKQMINLDILHQHTTDTLKQVVKGYDKSIYNFHEDEEPANAILKVRLPKAGAYVDSKDIELDPSQKMTDKITGVSKSKGAFSRFESKVTVSDFEEANPVEDDIPPPKKRKKGATKKTASKINPSSTEKHGSLKLKLSYKPKTSQSLDTEVTLSESERSEELSQRLNIPTIRGGLNGSIADILEASGYGAETDVKIEPGSKGAAQPSMMRDAIQGMLSMSQESSGNLEIVTQNRRPQRSRENLGDSDEEEKLMADCYRDSEFVYPSLDVSDEEESYVYNAKKNKRDITWNPKARVNVTVANPIRPVRVGVKKEAIECSLAATAKKLAETTVPTTKEPFKSETIKSKERWSTESEPQALIISESGSAFRPGIRKVVSNEPGSPPKSKKPKKGTTTAKQRLGKILKIHKLVH